MQSTGAAWFETLTTGDQIILAPDGPPAEVTELDVFQRTLLVKPIDWDGHRGMGMLFVEAHFDLLADLNGYQP